MPYSSDIISALDGIVDPTVDRAMAAALPTAGPEDLVSLANTLIQRGHPDGLLGLILHFHVLPDPLQRRIIEMSSELFRPLRQAVGHSQTQGPANTIRIVQESLATRMAYLVGEQLRHGSEQRRDLAATALLDMARRCATDPHPGRASTVDAEAAAYLTHALEEAVIRYGNHLHRTVLVAMAAMLPRPTPEAFAALADPKHPASDPMRGVMTSATEPAVRRALILLLAVPGLGPSAIDGLRQANQAERLGDAMAGWHLLHLAPVRRPLCAMRSPETLWPAPPQIKAMEEYQRRGLAAWAVTLPFDHRTTVARLKELTDHAPDPATRLMALRRLLVIERGSGLGDPVHEAILRFTRDDDPALVRIALWHLIRRKHPDLPDVLGRLAHSPDESIRAIATRHLAPLGFTRLWEGWPKMSPERRLAAGRALIKIEPNFHRMIGDKMLPNDRESRLRALSIIHDLNQGVYYEQALVRLAQEDDERVASAAVKALGSAATDRAVAVLERALEHGDARVRANAIEALAELRPGEYTDHWQQMTENEDNRPRANAIAALMEARTGDALRALALMLEDDRPEHRQSALWLVEKRGLTDLARHVAEMSITDPDKDVQQRADRVIHDMIAMMMTADPEDEGVFGYDAA